MRMIRTYRFALLLLAFAIGAGRMPLHSQTLTVTIASSINFNLANRQLVPGGDLQINLSCVPGPAPQTCPTTASIYVDFSTFCGLQADPPATASIPGSFVEVRVNTGAMIPLNSPAPPSNNGCGAQLYYNAVFAPAGTSFPAFMYINLKNSTVQPATYKGVLTITVDTL